MTHRLLLHRMIVGLLWIIIAGLLPELGRAQDVLTPLATEETTAEVTPTAELSSTEPPLPRHILAASVEWATVATLRSAFTFAVPLENISDATVTIEQPGWSGSPLEVAVDLQEFADIDASAAEVVHLLDIDPDSAPDLFVNTTITWSFTYEDETTAEFVERILYADSRTEWTAVHVVPEQVLVVVPENRYPSTSLRTQLEPVVELLEANTSQTPQLNVVLFDTRLPLSPCQISDEGESITTAPLSNEDVPCDAETIAAVYASNGYTSLELPSLDLSRALNTVTSELFNSVYTPLWEENEADIPLWFQAGLERYYWPTAKLDLLGISQQAVRTGGVIRDMESAPSDANRDAWLAQSYGMVLYISDQIGVEGLFNLAERVTAGESFEEVYGEIAGGELSGLIPAWSNWTLSRAAEGAYALYPYLPPTPTPTASYTRTPTYTPTPTASQTPSLAPSVTGELSATPSQTPPASNTPTETATETLTVTPRSMESLFTPTLVPPDPSVQNTANFLSAFSLGLIGLGVLLLISVLAYGFFQRNRGQ